MLLARGPWELARGLRPAGQVLVLVLVDFDYALFLQRHRHPHELVLESLGHFLLPQTENLVWRRLTSEDPDKLNSHPSHPKYS
jgi:hypothetical protein